MHYFDDCTTLEAVEARKRTLALQLHPDRGGRHEDMVEMMRQYEARKDVITQGRRQAPPAPEAHAPQQAPYQAPQQAHYQAPQPTIPPADIEAFIMSWAPVVVEGVKAFEAIRSVFKDVERRQKAAKRQKGTQEERS